MATLRTLCLDNNQIDDFSGLHLSGLETLSLSRNRITEIKDTVQELVALQTLRLDWNGIRTLPYAMRFLTSLKHLRLEGSPLTRPTLVFVNAKMGPGVVRWAARAWAGIEANKRRAICDQFRAVLRVVEEKEWAHASVFNPNITMTFDGNSDEWCGLVWDDFFSEVWGIVRFMARSSLVWWAPA